MTPNQLVNMLRQLKRDEPNDISEKWEFNYKPEPQGGFFNFALYDRNLSFGEAARQIIGKYEQQQSTSGL